MDSGEVLSKMKDVLQSDQLRYFSSEGISLSKQKLEVEKHIQSGIPKSIQDSKESLVLHLEEMANSLKTLGVSSRKIKLVPFKQFQHWMNELEATIKNEALLPKDQRFMGKDIEEFVRDVTFWIEYVIMAMKEYLVVVEDILKPLDETISSLWHRFKNLVKEAETLKKEYREKKKEAEIVYLIKITIPSELIRNVTFLQPHN